MFLVPKTCYGTLKEVKKESNKVVKSLFKTVNVEEAFMSQGFIDIYEVRRPIVVHSHKGDGTEAIFPGNALSLLFEKRYDKYVFGEEIKEAIRGIILQLCQSDWGTLALTTNDGHMLLWDFVEPLREGKEPAPVIYVYLQSVVKYWDKYEEIGQNFFYGSTANYLWDLPNGLKYVLANLGVSGKNLESPLGSKGLAGIIPNSLMMEIKKQAP